MITPVAPEAHVETVFAANMTRRERHLARLDRRLAVLKGTSNRWSRIRLALFLVGAGLATGLAWQDWTQVAWWIGGVALVAFIIVARQHRQVDARRQHMRWWRQLHIERLARQRLDWEQLPETSKLEADVAHPFSADLDVFGERSVHRLLDATETAGGSAKLSAWLSATEPDVAATMKRQHAVRQLVRMPVFRQRLALLGRMMHPKAPRWDGTPIERWLASIEVHAALRTWAVGLTGLALLNVALIIAHAMGWVPALWLGSVVLYIVLYGVQFGRLQQAFAESEALVDAFRAFMPPLTFLERYRLKQAPNVEAICAPIQHPNQRPSELMQRVQRIATAASVTRSELLLVLLNALVPWNLIVTYLLHRTKGQLRTVVPQWFEAWYTLDALCALATFADDHPHYTFPEFAEDDDLIQASEIGHPLIDAVAKVRNTVTLHEAGEVLLITGSNMAGKSTFMRTLGVNVVLAWAGGVVDAHRLRLRPLRLFSCMQVQDSVNDGFSFFYAEVRRLRALLDALYAEHDAPLLYLIDEIFRGTNNRERFMGSQAYIRELASGNGAGLLATHDLDLVRLADELPRLRNLHFREEVADGRMTFDYTLRDGPCPTTNALKIMAMEGLPVPKTVTDP
ncbi:MAG: MutS family DNA mismatch repair protein [Rhodothermales bacterium]